MIVASSERVTAEGTKISQMGDNVIATKEELSLPANFDLTSIAYQNREAVSFENASINVDNSTDVIFGPVTHFNVNGNVTIVQNGNGEDSEGDIEKKNSITSYGPGKMIESSQMLKTWMVQITRQLVCSCGSVIVIISSGTLILVIGLFVYIIFKQLSNQAIHTDSQQDYGHHLGNHSIYYKHQWGGKLHCHGIIMPHPVGLVIISHSNSKPCHSFDTCSTRMKYLEKHESFKGLWDICFNFAIGGDGNIYVGRGWDTINCHDHLSIGISFLGNFNIDHLNFGMINATKALIQQGVSLGKLSEDYMLVGHNQSSKLDVNSPGKHAFKEIRKWKHYSDMILYNETIVKNGYSLKIIKNVYNF